MINVKKPLGGALAGYTYVEGTSHQAGTSRLEGSLWSINECLKITKDFANNDVILQLNRNVRYAYGVIVQVADGITTVTRCLAQNDTITINGSLLKKNGAYPAIILTTQLM